MRDGRRRLDRSLCGWLSFEVYPKGQLDRRSQLKKLYLCFGDEDLRTLYVTTADNQADKSLGGCIFRLRVGVAVFPHTRVRFEAGGSVQR